MAPPEQLGPYRIGRRLGRGGMGTVYAAVRETDEQTAAVKVLAAALSQDEGFRDRFEAEVESLRKLRHPHIVRLFGFGEQDGLLFYAMELVVGRSLEEELAAGRKFDWSEVTRIAIQTCRALKHAHDRGIIHRDIKPANLMLTAAQEVKLSDFGIAKLFGSSGMTVEGGIIGTAEYMAPEQADGRAATDRTDLYSLGGVMYTLLARRPPFRAKTLPEMLQLQRFAEPDPVRRYAPDTPPELDKIITQLLAKEPEKRLANAGVLARRLEAMIEEMAEPAPIVKMAARTDEQIANAPTLAAPENGDPARLAPGTLEFLPPAAPQVEKGAVTSGLAATMAGDADSQNGADQGFELAPTIARQTTRIFKTVEEADEEDAEREREPQHAFSMQTAALVVALLILGGVIWYSLQPESVDVIYARVEAAGEKQQLSTVEPEINLLLDSYKSQLDITQRARLEGYLEELQLEAMERKYDREARRVSNRSLTPIERAYVDAIRTVRRDEAAGLKKLEAIVAIFTASREEHETTSLCLKLARRQIRAIHAAMEDTREDDVKLIEAKLSDAAAWSEEDPLEARIIYEGLLELFSDRPWFPPYRERMEKLLGKLPPPTTTEEPVAVAEPPQPTAVKEPPRSP